jgi:hypothetical protein
MRRVGHCGSELRERRPVDEGVRNSVPRIDVGAEFVVAAVEV